MVVRFADARRAGDADAHGLAGIGKELLHKLSRLLLMVGRVLSIKRDRARERRAVAGAERRSISHEGRRRPAGVCPSCDVLSVRIAQGAGYCRAQGNIAKARAGNPRPSFTFGQVTTISAPFGGTLSRLAITSIW